MKKTSDEAYRKAQRSYEAAKELMGSPAFKLLVLENIETRKADVQKAMRASQTDEKLRELNSLMVTVAEMENWWVKPVRVFERLVKEVDDGRRRREDSIE